MTHPDRTIQNPDTIVFEEFVLVRNDGSEVPIRILIGRPYHVQNDEWACPAELSGIDGRYPDISGSGSLQALGLALNLIKTRLGHLLENGERIYCKDDRSSYWSHDMLDSLFGVFSDHSNA